MKCSLPSRRSCAITWQICQEFEFRTGQFRRLTEVVASQKCPGRSGVKMSRLRVGKCPFLFFRTVGMCKVKRKIWSSWSTFDSPRKIDLLLMVLFHLQKLRYGYESKPWYLVNPKIAGKWMFIPLKCIYRYWPIPRYETTQGWGWDRSDPSWTFPLGKWSTNRGWSLDLISSAGRVTLWLCQNSYLKWP